MQIQNPFRSAAQTVSETEHDALNSVGYVVMAGAVIAAEVLIAGEELVYPWSRG